MITEIIFRNSERNFSLQGPNNIPQKLKIRCVLFGLAFGFCGTLWILGSHRIPLPNICYHVPLAAAFGAWLPIVHANFRERDNYEFIVITVLSLMIIAGRIFLKWPVSGHGILGALIAVLGCWIWLRLFATAILFQAFITKLVMDTQPLSVLYGALVGIAIAELALMKLFFTEKDTVCSEKTKKSELK